MRAFHGKIVTCNEDASVFEYLVEDKGKIVHVGDDLPNKYRVGTKVTELGEKALLPAFGDAHIHFSNWALFNSTFDVREARDLRALGGLVKDYAARNEKAKVILGFGASKHCVEEKRYITREELDEFHSEKPAIIIAYDGHSAMGNSALFDLFPPEVRSLRGFDGENGHLFHEAFYAGTDFATSLVPTTMLVKSILEGVNELAQRGIGMVHPVEGVGFPKDMDVDLVRFVAKGSQIQFRVFFQTMDIGKVLKRKLPRVGGCFSTALDGCFGAVDAALVEPYANDPDNRGILFHSDEEVENFTREANRAGLQVEMHAIGDAAVHQAVAALARALEDKPRDDHRHTVIHASLIQPDDLEKMAELGIGVTLQPSLLNNPVEPLEYLVEILGEDRAMGSTPLRTLLDAGIHVSGGSDGPVTHPDPIDGIYSACNHFNPEQSVTVAEALRMYTYEVAWMGFDEAERGTLEVEKVADLVVLNKNPLEVDPKDLRSLAVESVLYSGKPYKPKKGLLGMVWRGIRGRGKKI
ncbi:MAG: amidohydrolase [Promethearchaeota archaeon]